jgi:hypothetical protein
MPIPVRVNIISDILLLGLFFEGGKFYKLPAEIGAAGFLISMFFIVGCGIYSACVYNRD